MAEIITYHCDDRTWSQITKAALDREIERGYQKLKDAPVLKRPLKTKLDIKTEAEASILKRLDEMYKDPQYGPDFFLKNAKLIRHYLGLYRLSISNPQDHGLFFHCASPSPGIIIHFNSAKGKREIFFLLPSGNKPRQKPIKVKISTILRWHQNRRVRALNAQLKEMKEMLSLRKALTRAINDFRNELSSTEVIHDKFNAFLQELFKELAEIKIKTRTATKCITSKKVILEEAKDTFVDFLKDREEVAQRKADFDSLNPRMFDEKDFILMTINHYKSLTKIFKRRKEQLAKFMSNY